jgi:multiple sugar transport system permease protein
MLTVGVMLSNAQIQRDPMFTVRRHRFSCALLLLVVLMVSLQRFWKADLTAGATKG